MRANNSILRKCLANWKFTTALAHLDEESDYVKDIVKCLERLLGDSGYIRGDINKLVNYLVWYLLNSEGRQNEKQP